MGSPRLLWPSTGALLRAVCLAAGTVVTAPSYAATLEPDAYAGSGRCGQCHPDHHDGWSQTFHATVVQDARTHPDAVLGDFTQPGINFTLSDVEYTIGGHKDQRYMKQIGEDYYVLPYSWSVQAQTWRRYNPYSWKKRPYSTFCKGCHVTGYDPKGNVPVAESRIGCEACHGPGWDHAESGGVRPIVHPGKLPKDRRDMICGACHVRGLDKSGEYQFPIGFLPGEDLGLYFVPHEREEGETNSRAILRGFTKWFRNWQRFGGQPCEVCEIPGRSGSPMKSSPPGPMDACFRCHAFKERYAQHTHHPVGVAIVCLDCHKKQVQPIDQPAEVDIHTPQYFLQHAGDCYDRRLDLACLACHTDRDRLWARRTAEQWAAPATIDH